MIAKRRSTSTKFLPQTLIVLAACAGPRIDAGTDGSCVSSLAQVSKQALGSPDSARYAQAMVSTVGQLAFTGLGEAFGKLGRMFDNQAPSVEMPPPDSLLFRRALCDALNGMTAQQIVARGDSVVPLVKRAYERRYAPLQIHALQAAQARYPTVPHSPPRFPAVSPPLNPA